MKKESKTIGTWYGKPIEKLKRKELLEVIKVMAEELERNRATMDFYEEIGSTSPKRRKYHVELFLPFGFKYYVD